MTPSYPRCLLALLALPFAACTVGEITGGGGDDVGGDDVVGDDDPGPAPDAAVEPAYAIAVTPPTQTTNLGTVLRYQVVLSSTNFTGAVDLAATGVPESWTATFEPSASINVPLDGTATAELVVTVPTDGEAAVAAISIDATGAPGAHSAVTSMTVANELVVEWGAGTGAGAHAMPGNLAMRLGATLHIRNGDTAQHRVHSDGGPGFPHQDNNIGQGQEYVVVPGDVGGYRFYCHVHGDGSGVTNLTVR